MSPKHLGKTAFLLLLFSSLSLFSGCDVVDDKKNNTEEPIVYQVPTAEEVVMYEVNPRVFAETNSLKAITARLDEIKALGTNVIWIMPIYEEGVLKGKGSPYCIKNYRKIDSEYGTLSDFKTFVKEAHKRGIAVLMDWVANHTSWDNAWITEHKDFYTKDANDNIISPIPDWSDVADLDYNNTAMRDSMISAMTYWITETNIDGFRCDAADFVPADFWSTAVAALRNINTEKKLFMLAEGNLQDYFSLGFDMDYGWNFYTRLKNLYAGTLSMKFFNNLGKNELNQFPEGKHRLYFTTNHDKSAWEETDVQLFNGQKGALSAFVIAATFGNSPLIYSTQEIGREEKVPFFSYTAIDWNSNPEVLIEYKKIMAIYTSSDIFRNKYLTLYDTSANPNIVFYTHTNGVKEVLVVVNVRNEEKTFTVPEALAGKVYKNLMDNTDVMLTASMQIPAYQYYILERK